MGPPKSLLWYTCRAAQRAACCCRRYCVRVWRDSSHLLTVRLPPAWNNVVSQRASSSLNLSHRFTSALAGDPCMGIVVGDKTIFVAHKNHSIEHNRVISNHSRTPLSYEDVVRQHHSFRSTAVVQFGRSRGGRLSLPKKNEAFNHLQRCDHFFGVFVTCWYFVAAMARFFT